MQKAYALLNAKCNAPETECSNLCQDLQKIHIHVEYKQLKIL